MIITSWISFIIIINSEKQRARRRPSCISKSKFLIVSRLFGFLRVRYRLDTSERASKTFTPIEHGNHY